MTLTIGARVPELTFTAADGRPVALSAFLGRPLVVIFLRHLG
jgi:peroxiredoxin